MKTDLDISKIKHVILFIIQYFPNGIDYIKLFKILYFAQQDHIVRFGKVIFNDSFRALKHGPVPSFTYKALQCAEGKEMNETFDDFLDGLCVINKKVYSEKLPDMDFLSGSNIKSLENIIQQYKDTDPYDLSDLSHDEAWKDAYNRAQDDPQKNYITLIDIARAGVASEPMVKYLREKQIINKALK